MGSDIAPAGALARPPLPVGARDADHALHIYDTLLRWQQATAAEPGCPSPGITAALRDAARPANEHRTGDPVPSKPPRQNFAGVCLWCGAVDCEEDRCVDLWRRSEWMVCPYCEGGLLETPLPCGCVNGVTECGRVPDGSPG